MSKKTGNNLGYSKLIEDYYKMGEPIISVNTALDYGFLLVIIYAILNAFDTINENVTLFLVISTMIVLYLLCHIKKQ